MPSVMSVRGEVSDAALGFTLPHEHLFVDLRCYCPTEIPDEAKRSAFHQPVSQDNRDLVIQNPWGYEDNPILDDLESAVSEADVFAELGGRTIADLSCSPAINRHPLGLMHVAIQTGVNIIMSAGRYALPSLSESDRERSVEAIEAGIMDEFSDGVEGGVRPGLLKAAFVDHIDKEPEIRTLRAVGRAQAKIGCALAVHPHIWEPDSHRILDILEDEGCDLRRVILCHQDFLGNCSPYLASLCKRGAYVEFDTFGSGWINDRMWQQTDLEKIAFLKKIIDLGQSSHLLISGDMCLKIMLSKWGGNGYRHIPESAVPAMREAGLSNELVHLITVENPAQVLCH